jgi:penicillin-binding protein 2
LKEEPLDIEELQLFSRRDLMIRALIGVPFAGIVWRLWDLQIKDGVAYSELSKGNRIRLQSEAAPRGIIFDRNEVMLAKNIPSYTLILVREDTPDVDAVLKKLSVTLQIPLAGMVQAVENNRRAPRFHPIMLNENLTFRQAALIGAYQEAFPGISIEITPRRFYPFQQTTAHVCGYMSEISREQLKTLPKNRLQSARRIGQKGVELVYNNVLIGTDGGRQVEVDHAGRIKREFPNSIRFKPGNDIVLSIDSRLQQKVEETMGQYKGGAVVMKPGTGEVLALVSLPAFDPNEFSQGLSRQRWQELKDDPDHVLNNKCIQGVYSPGSTFKMVVAAAALEVGVIDSDTQHLCEGQYRLGRRLFHCWHRGGHGRLNVVEAIENSCNVFFFRIALELGIDTIKEYAERFGLGKVTGIDLQHEFKALIPGREWYAERFDNEWMLGETLNAAIGQGYVSTTPLQLCNYTNVIASGGYLPRPRLIKSIIEHVEIAADTRPQYRAEIKPQLVERQKVDLKSETLKILQQGMKQNVQGINGTGKAAYSSFVSIAGKTGTTQVVSLRTRDAILRERGELDERYHNHAWFIGFAPVDNPRISMAIMLENGRSGRNAAMLTKQVFEYYFTQLDPQSTNSPIT